jgi:hypothetical protein
VVAVFRAKLDRSRQDMEREAWQLAAARVREDESLAELRRRIQEAEEVAPPSARCRRTPTRSAAG